MEPAELVLELVLLDVHGEPHLALTADPDRPPEPVTPAAPATAPGRDRRADAGTG